MDDIIKREDENQKSKKKRNKNKNITQSIDFSKSSTIKKALDQIKSKESLDFNSSADEKSLSSIDINEE